MAMKCPECGVNMESGYLGCESNEFTKPSWYRKKSVLGIGGEKLAGFHLNLHYFDGFHCRGCRVVVIRY